MNYGALGSIIGHEWMHGFDTQGNKFNSKGNMENIWSNSTIRNFENITDCLVKQYTNHRDKQVNFLLIINVIRY